MFRGENMRKVIVILALVLLCIPLFMACGQSSVETPEKQSFNKDETKKIETTAAQNIVMSEKRTFVYVEGPEISLSVPKGWSINKNESGYSCHCINVVRVNWNACWNFCSSYCCFLF